MVKTKAELDKIIKEEELVLVYFYAEWCDPCEELSKLLDKAAEFLTRALSCKVVRINTDKVLDKELNKMGIALPVIRLYHLGANIRSCTGLAYGGDDE